MKTLINEIKQSLHLNIDPLRFHEPIAPVIHLPSLPTEYRYENLMSKTPAAITAYQKYGVAKSSLAYMCVNNWNFPEDFRDCLTDYYLLQWEGKYFAQSLKDGIIRHLDKEYAVVYKNCTYFAAKKASQLRLSFRKPQPEFDLSGYVIVSVFTAPDRYTDPTAQYD